SLAMVEGAVLGTAPLGTSVESSAGIAIGGRTGLTAIFVGILFLVSMIFSPLLALIPTTVTPPALLILGVFMSDNLAYTLYLHFFLWFSLMNDRLSNYHDCFQTLLMSISNDVHFICNLCYLLLNY